MSAKGWCGKNIVSLYLQPFVKQGYVSAAGGEKWSSRGAQKRLSIMIHASGLGDSLSHYSWALIGSGEKYTGKTHHCKNNCLQYLTFKLTFYLFERHREKKDIESPPSVHHFANAHSSPCWARQKAGNLRFNLSLQIGSSWPKHLNPHGLPLRMLESETVLGNEA